MQFLVENGINAGVSMAPILPGLSDSPESINAVVEAAANHGAQFLSANLLFLKPGSKEWFMPLIREAHPNLAPGYAQLYRKTYAPQDYTRSVLKVVDEARLRWGLTTPKPPRLLPGPQMQLELALTA